MPRYEFEVITLRNEPLSVNDRRYRWKCRRAEGDCDYEGLEGMLNELGRKGWSVVAHDTDGRFGSTVILQRQLEGDTPPATPPAEVRPRRERSAPQPADPGISAALLAEVQALRREVAQHSLSYPVAAPAPAINFAPITETLTALLTELRAERSVSVEARLSESSLRRLETAAAALAQSVELAATPRLLTVLEPKPKPWFQWLGQRLGWAR